jgi:urea transporter
LLVVFYTCIYIKINNNLLLLLPKSALVLAGIMVCSRIAALSAFIGSAIGAAVAAFVGSPSDVIEQGLFGFNPALTLSALLMFYVPGTGSSSVGIVASIITVFIQLALSSCLEPYGLPSMVSTSCCFRLCVCIFC